MISAIELRKRMNDNKLKPIDLLVKRAADNGINYVEVNNLSLVDIAELGKLGYLVMSDQSSSKWTIYW